MAADLFVADDTAQVSVSVIMPVYNEEKYIGAVLEQLFRQDWKEPFEVVIVDGNSTDNTVRKVNEASAGAPAKITVRLLKNPHRHIPRSLNIGIAAAQGEILIRLDGHTVPPADFVRRSVEGLRSIGLKGIVGGRCRIVPGGKTLFAAAIALAVAHPIGTGNAAYRSKARASEGDGDLIPVDTVPFGCFTKGLWKELGGYDEQLLSAEDYDFAFRARQRGYGVYLDPGLILEYFARPTLSALAKQYFRYGQWTSRLLKKHKRVPAARKLAPLGLVTSTAALTLYAPSWAVISIVLYIATLTTLVVRDSSRAKLSLRDGLGMILAFVVLHWSYGLGNWYGFLTHRRVIYEDADMGTGV